MAAVETPEICGTMSVETFKKMICSYYAQQGRDLPWRHTTNPYHIYVSEIMLQQTQVERVLVKYGAFIAAFPDFETLAEASLADVLRVWQGMGYNRRAKALKEGAKRVVDTYHGSLPHDEEILITLPGIGKATAASIAAFAFNEPAVFIETNIRRVFIHFFFPGQEAVHDRDIMPLVKATLDTSHPREWYYALMDYGSMLKKRIPNPNRRSAGYARQSRFEGSDRQIRGCVLSLLLEQGAITRERLVRMMDAGPGRVDRIVDQLGREGFVIQDGKFLLLA